jgi:hypothetical protein
MDRKWIAALVMGITMAAGAAQAHNDPNNPIRQCIADARTTNQTCTKVCRDDFQSAVDACRGVNHDCADQARATRQMCVSDVLTALDKCISDNCSVYKDVIAQCRKDNPAGSEALDACIDGQQVLNFQCRDQCREDVKLFQSLKTCRDEFRTDINACAPPTTTPPTMMGP